MSGEHLETKRGLRLCLVPPQAPLTDSEENTPVLQLLMPPPHYCKDSSVLLWVGLLCRLSLALHKYKYKHKFVFAFIQSG